MENYIVPCVCAGIIIVLIVIQLIMRSRHPVRSAFFGLLPGLIALLFVNLLQGYTSVSIPVSPLSLTVSAVLGIPGVTALLIIQRLL